MVVSMPISEDDFREFCQDTTYTERELEDDDSELMCTIMGGSGGRVTEVVYKGDTIEFYETAVEIDASDARIYGNGIATREEATKAIGGNHLQIGEDYKDWM